MNAPSQSITEYMAEAHRKAKEAAVKLATAIAAGEAVPNDRLAKAITAADMTASDFEILVNSMRDRARLRRELAEVEPFAKRIQEIDALTAKLDKTLADAEEKHRLASEPLDFERTHLQHRINSTNSHRWKLIEGCPIESLRLAYFEADRRFNALRDGIREREEKIESLNQQFNLKKEAAARGGSAPKPDIEHLAKIHAREVPAIEADIARMRRELAQAEIDTKRSADAAFQA